MKRPRGTGSIYQKKGRPTWWIKYHRNGVAIRESSKSEKLRVAQNLLTQRIAEVSEGTWIDPRNRKITVDQLFAALLDDYRNNNRSSLAGTRERWQTEEGKPGRLQKHFGGWRAVSITTEVLNRYIGWAKDAALSNATINRDLSALRRAFYLALDAGKIKSVPKFPHLKEDKPRSGFVEEAEFRRLAENAKQLWLRALMTSAYTFGFRAGELLGLRVKQISLPDSTITLNPGETKSGKGRIVKMTPDVATLLTALVRGKTAEDYVFTRPNGKPVRDYREVWNGVCKAAGMPDKLFHDLRRSAVRNMIRRGVSQKVAMKISGHETVSVFDRYNITDEADLVAAAEKIQTGKKLELAREASFGHLLGTIEETSPTTIPAPPPQKLQN